MVIEGQGGWRRWLPGWAGGHSYLSAATAQLAHSQSPARGQPATSQEPSRNHQETATNQPWEKSSTSKPASAETR